ncbi:DUF4333 domain-containing protein [Nakamurella alba]|uniref:DUF4333 domain-containing protein n=1 Tax=Nakamurella alba TaxID=2665158 RepID=UPI0018A9BB95|nr:DUF4333 domain-containing protein [Nakamurella alba]
MLFLSGCQAGATSSQSANEVSGRQSGQIGPRFFDQDAVEAGVLAILSGPAPSGYALVGISDVTCPDDQPVVAGSSFVCVVTQDGSRKKATVTVKDDEGLYEVGIPAEDVQAGVYETRVFNRVRLESGVLQILTEPAPRGYALSGVSDVACPSDQEVNAGTSFLCAVTQDGVRKNVTVSVKNDNGTYEVGIPAVEVQETSVTTSTVRPVGRIFDQVALESGVMKILTDQAPGGYGLVGIEKVSCPTNQPVAAGTSFVCSVLQDGLLKSVTVTVKDDDGLYEVGIPA